MAPRGVLTAARVLPLAMALAYLGTAAGDRRHPDNSAAAAAATPPQWTCERGMDAFCQCDPRLRDATPELCSVAAAQCRASFCSPVCTSMAWGVRVSVDCSAAPGWHDCPRYAAAMHAGGGAAAVEAQFKAHVCSRVMGCCDGEDKALQWRVDEALYRDHYPRPVLPAAGCTGAGNGEARCAACRAATRVSLTADASLCAPSAPTLAETYVVQPLSLHERCEFVTDVVQSAADQLQAAFDAAVCSCTGCCDDAAATAAAPDGSSRRLPTCLYDLSPEDDWLAGLLAR